MQENRQELLIISAVFGALIIGLSLLYLYAKPDNKTPIPPKTDEPVVAKKTEPQTTALSGDVRNESNDFPLEDVTVTIGSNTTKTDKAGLYYFDKVEVGSAEATYGLPKFETLKIPLNLAENPIIKVKLKSKTSTRTDKKQSQEAIDLFIGGALPSYYEGSNKVKPLNKKNSPIKIHLEGDASPVDTQCVNAFIDDINKLTDTYYFKLAKGDYYNMRIYILDRKSAEAKLGAINNNNNNGYFWNGLDQESSLEDGIVWVNTTIQDPATRCFVIRKYFTHAIGFPNSPTTNKSSILYPDDLRSDSSWNDLDKTIISMMYSYDLPPGLDEAGVRNFFK